MLRSAYPDTPADNSPAVAALLLVLLADPVQDTSPSSLLALPIALQHPVLSASPQILCAAACVCKDWREAVQQCAACNTDVQLRLDDVPSSSVAAATHELRNLPSFASWLAEHGALVRSMAFYSVGPPDWQLEDKTCTVSEATVQLLCQAMQQAAATRSLLPITATGCTATIEAAAAAEDPGPVQQQQQRQQQQQQPGLRLASFTSDAAWALGLLPVLPVHSLTCLKINLKSSRSLAQCGHYAAALAAAPPRLGSLQQLTFTGDLMGKLDSCMSVLGQLSKLTCLQLKDMEWAQHAKNALQQMLLRPHPLRVLHVESDGYCYARGDAFRQPPLDMGCLQQLQEFICCGALPQLSVLPVQLQHVALGTCLCDRQLAAVMPLQQLTALQFVMHSAEQEPLLRLAQLPALQQLRLQVYYWDDAAATAPAWAKLPQLCELALYDDGEQNTRQHIAAVVAAIAAATNLTKLCLEFPHRIRDQLPWATAPVFGAEGGQQQGPVDVCAIIAGLVRLEHLQLCLRQLRTNCSPRLAEAVVPGDVVALTALTGLTHLDLSACGACVGD
jgi:hypothetical protein